MSCICKGNEERVTERNVLPSVGCSMCPQPPCACHKCKRGSPRGASLPPSLSLSCAIPSHAQLQLSLPQAGLIRNPPRVNGKIPDDFSEEGSVSSGKRGRENLGQGYDFTVCVHRMSLFPHGGTLATLPTFLVLSVRHCTWSYLPFTRELI